jgi:transposase
VGAEKSSCSTGSRPRPRSFPPWRCGARARQRPGCQDLRQIYRLPAKEAIELLDEWIAWARRCRLAAFVKLARTITKQRAGIIAAIEHGLSNARVEAINTQIRMITRRAYGFHSASALIALAMLSLAGLCPPLPR